MNIRTELWMLFGAIVLVSLVIDFVLPSHRRRKAPMSVKEAALWTCFWIGLSLGFNAIVYGFMGPARATEFFTAYLIEESLSVDNMFIFMLIFSYFKVPDLYQPKVLKYGILGAIVMRLTLIYTGVALLQKFHWVFYLFGVLLLVTAFHMFRDGDKEFKPEANGVLRLCKRFLPFVDEFHEDRFLIRQAASWAATPLLATLLVIEATDLLFAVDSIPAVLAISRDPFIIFSSNVFAVLGLRSLYFVLHGAMGMFHYLKYGLGIILFFIGAKMLLADVYPIPTSASLGIVAVCLAASIAWSLLNPRPS